MRRGLAVLGLVAVLAACTSASSRTDVDQSDGETAEASEPAAETDDPSTSVTTSTAPVEPTTDESTPVESSTAVPAETTSTTSTTTTEPFTHPPLEPTSAETGFATVVAPILLDHCASCHNPGGSGSAHWYLSTARDVVDVAPFIVEQVSSGVMPPWPASDLGVPYAKSLGLTDDEFDAVIGWLDAGAALDVEAETPMFAAELAAELTALEDPLVVGPIEAYGGDSGRYDDYRCLVYQPDLTEGAWLTGYQFVADQTEVVHHALGYLIPAREWEAAMARDARDEGSGWECFGGTGLDDTFVVGWAPGQLPGRYPEGSGLRLEAGDFFVVQVHYHYDTRPGPDASWLELQLEQSDVDLEPVTISQYLTPAEIPCGPGEAGPLCDRTAAMARAVGEFGVVPADLINLQCRVSPADFADMTDGTAWSSCDLPVMATGEIISVLGHMHALGATYRMTLNPDTDEELVLLDIPDWDYDWQYNYEPAQSIVLERGDVLRFECSWERSRRDPDLEPAYVLWSFGSDDEMCFSTVVTRPTP